MALAKKLESIIISTKLTFLRNAFYILNNFSLFSGVLAWLCSKSIKEVTPDGRIISFTTKPVEERITALFLSYEKFRDDYIVLSATKKIRSLIIKGYWQTRFVNIFYPKQFINSVCLHTADDDSPLAWSQERFRAFLQVFLTSLYKTVQVDCVIGSDVRNEFDFDWGVVSKAMGVPYIVFHRENLVASLNLYNNALGKFKGLKRFKGDYIVVHNNAEKHMIIESGYADESQISALGCLRMDDFIKRINKGAYCNPQKKKLLFFTFHTPSVGIDVYQKVITTIAKLAIQHYDIDVIIKPKADFFEKCEKESMDKVFKDADINPDKIQNLEILPYADAQELILSSDVVCAINSTVMLEAGIAGKSVIVPFFNECQETTDRLNDILLKEYFHLFEVAIDEIGLKSKILANLHTPIKITEEIMEGRKKVFEEFVSSMNADATENYLSLIEDVSLKSHSHFK